MRFFCTFVAIVACAIGCGLSVRATNEEPEAAGEDSSGGLPGAYAKNYLIATSTVSPNKKFAVIYPTSEAEEAAEKANHPEHIKDYVSRCGLLPFWASYRRNIRTSNIRIMAGSVPNGRMTARSP